MGEQQSMSRVSDRVKQRREYSKQKREIYVAVVCFLAPFILLLVSLCFDISAMYCSNGTDDGSRPFDFTSIIMTNLLLTSVVLFEAHNEISNLPYVPPVTADTLPDEEVLLRG